MSDFTIEQLEAMKEKSPEGPWDWGYHGGDEVIVDATGEQVLWAEASNSEAFLDVAAGAGHLLVAGPELLDALIAEKQAHAELRAWVESLHPRVDSAGGGSAVTFHKAIFLDEITRILEAGNG